MVIDIWIRATIDRGHLLTVENNDLVTQ
jgi:hypothetical protein